MPILKIPSLGLLKIPTICTIIDLVHDKKLWYFNVQSSG